MDCGAVELEEGLGVAVAGAVVGAVPPGLDAGGAVTWPDERPADPRLGTEVAGRDVADGAGVALGETALGESRFADADATPESLVSLSSDDCVLT